MKVFAFVVSHIVQQLPHIVTWLRPSVNSVAFNVDDMIFLDSSLESFGGLIRDHTCSKLYLLNDHVGQTLLYYVALKLMKNKSLKLQVTKNSFAVE